jgi:hypothetical protein
VGLLVDHLQRVSFLAHLIQSHLQVVPFILQLCKHLICFLNHLLVVSVLKPQLINHFLVLAQLGLIFALVRLATLAFGVFQQIGVLALSELGSLLFAQGLDFFSGLTSGHLQQEHQV